MATSAVVGLGYVGLPFLIHMAEAGHQVIGIDVSQAKIESILAGDVDIDSGYLKKIQHLVDTKNVVLTTDFALIAAADFISICVPTPLDAMKTPDLSYVISAVQAIQPFLRVQQTVILESTTYPGTTEDLIRPMLESTGLKAGRDFYLGYSPERVDPGNTRFNIQNTPKVVGADDDLSLASICSFYGSFIDNIVPLNSAKAAEMTKLLENTFRAVNIAFINEMAIMAERLGINIWDVVSAASSKPFGFMPFFPGPGIGGHCIPLDPLYLSWKAKSVNFFSRFIDTAADVNNNMPHFVLDRVMRALGQLGKRIDTAKVLLLGMAYKANVKDARESPSRELFELLLKEGVRAEYNDPFVPSIDIGAAKHFSASLERLEQFDVVIAMVNHNAYDLDNIQSRAFLIYDTKNMFSADTENVIRLGDGTVPIADVLSRQLLHILEAGA